MDYHYFFPPRNTIKKYYTIEYFAHFKNINSVSIQASKREKNYFKIVSCFLN